MTRTEKLSELTAMAAQMSEAELEEILTTARYIKSGDSVYDTLIEDRKAEIDEAVASLNRGEGAAAVEMFDRVRARFQFRNA